MGDSPDLLSNNSSAAKQCKKIFWVFGYWIKSQESKPMNAFPSKCLSENRKSAIQNPKSLGFLAIVFTLAFGVGALAEQPAKIPKIGFLSSGTGSGSPYRSEVFQQQLRELGYIGGKNIAFESRYGEDNFDRLPALADELVRLKVDVLVINTTPAALAVKNATTTIPIVFLGVSDPVAVGLVDSLARPGGNITGLTNIAPVLAGKRLELLKETVPKLTRIAVLWDPRAPGSTQQWKESQIPARELNLQLYSMEVSSADKYEIAFKEATKARCSALAVTQNPLAGSSRKLIADLAAKHQLPAIYPRKDFVESGGLMSYGPDLAEPQRRAAVLVDRILKGAKPADLPVEQPTKFELLINLKTAKALGLKIPPIVLMRATKVIK
jgi:putative tryptophan/tyrosine transport system substrate-binding protein